MSVGAGSDEPELVDVVVPPVPEVVVVEVVPVEVDPVEFGPFVEDPPQALAPLPAQAAWAVTEESPPPPQPTRASERRVQMVKLLFIPNGW